jgi:hypothetical protein
MSPDPEIRPHWCPCRALFRENLGALAVDLTADDLTAVDTAAAITA